MKNFIASTMRMVLLSGALTAAPAAAWALDHNDGAGADSNASFTRVILGAPIGDQPSIFVGNGFADSMPSAHNSGALRNRSGGYDPEQ